MFVVINVINLEELNYKDEIVINEKVVFSRNYYENTDIIRLEDVLVNGKITTDIEYNYIINLDVSGVMYLHDSITFEEIPYPFTIKIEESLENSLKTLDLIEFLWHYIILEVPMRFTNSEISNIETDNYRVISEEEYVKKNNPFRDFFEN